MFDPMPDDTEHFRARADERALPAEVEAFIRAWGNETWAAGARQITLFRRDLPPDLRDTSIARRAEGWILVAAPNGALMTCYRRNDASRFLARKSDTDRRNRHRRGGRPPRRRAR
ncbi:MAG TPA: hypothetical protein VLT58_09640 [Polyangia bacterium]|nr:hypothetical protein [Polyangia bacterium]